jgi:hypothetical protein
MKYVKPSELVVFRNFQSEHRFIKKDLTAMDVKCHGHVSFTIHKEGKSLQFNLSYEDFDIFLSSVVESVEYGKTQNPR